MSDYGHASAGRVSAAAQSPFARLLRIPARAGWVLFLFLSQVLILLASCQCTNPVLPWHSRRT